MTWLMAKVYDRFNREMEERCLREWRTDLLRKASGRVLEIGAGTGANLGCYSRELTELVATEPDRHMRREFVRRRAAEDLHVSDGAGTPVRVANESVGSLSYADESFDTVVSTLVLCSVDDQSEALHDIRRVLRPGGHLLFLEHVAAQSNPRRLRWQQRVEPLWKRVAGNCHVTRDTESAILAAGFDITQIRRESMRGALPWVRPSIRGVALRP